MDPDADDSTAVIGPFTKSRTLDSAFATSSTTFHHEGYEREPRAVIAKAAEEYLEVHRYRWTTVLCWPGPILIFRRSEFLSDISGFMFRSSPTASGHGWRHRNGTRVPSGRQGFTSRCPRRQITNHEIVTADV